MNFKSLAAVTFVAAVPLASAGPVAYAACQTGCNGFAVMCYAAAGFTFGVTIVLVPPAILACGTALDTCMATCATVALYAPTP